MMKMTKKDNEFNVDESINELEIPLMLKEGLKHYIEFKNIKIKNKKELNKILKEYKELKI